jgi:hypothetical protein
VNAWGLNKVPAFVTTRKYPIAGTKLINGSMAIIFLKAI